MPSCIKGLLFSSCPFQVHSQMNMHTCPKFVPDRSSCLAYFLHFGICDPLTPSKYPLGLESSMFSADIYSQMYQHTCVKCGPDGSSGLEAFPDL